MILNDFKDKLITDINTSGLSIDAIYFVMKDLMNDITNQYNLILQQEHAAAVQKIEPTDLKESETEAAENKEKEE